MLSESMEWSIICWEVLTSVEEEVRGLDRDKGVEDWDDDGGDGERGR